MLNVENKRNDECLISIIVPVYNNETTIDRCIVSIQKQTHRNIEIIIVDDGSFDSTYYICKQIANKDERIKLIHTENKGVAKARNRGLAEASGEYVGFVDGDDWCESKMYETLLSAMQIYNSDIVWCSYDNNRNQTSYSVYNLQDMFPKDILNLTIGNGYVWNKLFKGNVIREKKLSFPNLDMKEDMIFVLNYLDFCSIACQINSHLYNYSPNLNNEIRLSYDKHKAFSDAYLQYIMAMSCSKNEIHLLYFSKEAIITIYTLFILLLGINKDKPNIVKKRFKKIVCEYDVYVKKILSCDLCLYQKILLLLLKQKNYFLIRLYIKTALLLRK